jgi:hypothetical protein
MTPDLMPRFPIDRRAFFVALASSLAGSNACARNAVDETASQALARLLGLERDETVWLDVLSDGRQRQLLEGLRSGDAPSSQTVDLLMQVLGRRERLFAYVGYPAMPNGEGCSGLIRE